MFGRCTKIGAFERLCKKSSNVDKLRSKDKEVSRTCKTIIKIRA